MYIAFSKFQLKKNCDMISIPSQSLGSPFICIHITVQWPRYGLSQRYDHMHI